MNTLTEVMNAFNVSFNNSSNVYNIFPKKVMPQQFATKFLILENIGKEKYHKFLKEQLNGEKSIWDTITKEKLPTFINSNKQVTVKINK